ncbi:alpha-galactosidase [Paenibacillus pectinilyticus]|uniref:Alpha-galactosidase n=1 Tax=Paenibacillus pectinilyticus TaxID=512399 RepID=A0A1C0ZWA8_9BACL|nr:alpha-galactosidase [Paenibacillus pectinilyticus]OCT12386.1 alpha-galactosidase [Paenibacillus pectinilyticus]
MSISFEPTQGIFHLQNKHMSYVLQIVHSTYLAHAYWGRPIRSGQLGSIIQYTERASFSPNPDTKNRVFSLDTLPQEFPAYGTSDFREPAYQVALPNGSTITELVYDKHRIVQGKPGLEGLPSTYVEADHEAETLEIELVDKLAGLRAILSYTIFANHAAITRSVRFINEGSADLKLLRALSMSLDYAHADWDLLQLSGSWARERHIERRALAPGKLTVESRRGSSSHSHNPFVALLSKEANEDHGDVYGFNLVYSGNFAAHAEVDPFATARVYMGINPFDFSWLLEPGQQFQTPEVVMVYSSNGLGEMSRAYHRLYRTRLCRGEYRDQVRPVLVNNWEATYFNFNADKIESIARAGKELGIELFVLDDGWFGKRNDDTTSLGDWVVDKVKLPGGIEDLVERVNNLGLEFGLWFEPEMVSPESDLYRNHPDWCLHVPDRRRTEGRGQLILDFSREDVREGVMGMLRNILSSAPITYVKWDMNRNMTEIGSASLPSERQRETAHRYILGLYDVLEKITSEYPHILFESCSGGGGRFDPGMLHYMPQTWTSDNTDAVCRLKIQYGTSIVYPVSSMGSHVSAVPNHQVHRTTSLETRGHVAMSGNFGYELDLTKFTDEEKEIVKAQVADYKKIRPLVQFGDMYRLLSPFEGNDTAWMIVSEDKTQAMVVFIRVLAQPYAPLKTLRLKGLNPDFDYQIEGSEGTFAGDHLLYAGLSVAGLHSDFESKIWLLEAKPQ